MADRAKPDYLGYVDYLESRGWAREQITLDENNTNLVTLFALTQATTGTVLDVRCPAGQKMSMMGTQQVPNGSDARTAHAFRVRLANTADTEIDLNTKVRVTKEKTSEAIIQLARCFYADICNTKNQLSTPTSTATFKTDFEWYRFKQGVELNGEQHMKLIVLNPNIPIDSSHVKFALDMDLWTKEE
jgi:hypothetical protein